MPGYIFTTAKKVFALIGKNWKEWQEKQREVCGLRKILSRPGVGKD
jgi:hypothetical protein